MKVGILGGGQLSQMLALAGIPLGLDFVFYEPRDNHCVAGLGMLIQSDYKDLSAVTQFAKTVDVVTYENENIPLETLEAIEAIRPLRPGIKALQLTQDRLLEKQFFDEIRVPTNQYQAIHNKDELLTAIKDFAFPAVLKQRRLGYDGKGQYVIKSPADITALPEEACEQAILESFVEFDREISVIAAVNQAGDIAYYDINENRHEDGILRRTRNCFDDPMRSLGCTYIKNVMKALEFVGICTVEFFQVGDKLLANEIAPRVHNSGHWTIEGAVTSQFENHLRAIIGWQLGDTSSRGACVMLNLLGQMPNTAELLSIPGLHLHDYQKSPANLRKLGHVTLSAEAYDRSFTELNLLVT